MPLKHGVDTHLIAPRHGQQRILGLIRPIEAKGSGVGNEEFVKRYCVIDLSHFLAHDWPGEVIDPGWVGSKQLGRPGRDPPREAGVGLFCGRDLPAHYQEHNIPVS